MLEQFLEFGGPVKPVHAFHSYPVALMMISAAAPGKHIPYIKAQQSLATNNNCGLNCWCFPPSCTRVSLLLLTLKLFAKVMCRKWGWVENFHPLQHWAVQTREGQILQNKWMLSQIGLTSGPGALLNETIHPHGEPCLLSLPLRFSAS